MKTSNASKWALTTTVLCILASTGAILLVCGSLFTFCGCKWPFWPQFTPVLRYMRGFKAAQTAFSMSSGRLKGIRDSGRYPSSSSARHLLMARRQVWASTPVGVVGMGIMVVSSPILWYCSINMVLIVWTIRGDYGGQEGKVGPGEGDGASSPRLSSVAGESASGGWKSTRLNY